MRIFNSVCVNVQFSAQNSTNMSMAQTATDKGQLCCYCVKVINVDRKSEFTVKRFDGRGKFTSVNELKKKLSELSVEICGYISPGHGLKGKNQRLDDNEFDECYRNSGKKCLA